MCVINSVFSVIVDLLYLSSRFLNFEVGSIDSVFRKPVSTIFIGFHIPRSNNLLLNCYSGAKLSRLKATLAEQMRVKRDEALARRYELFGERYGGDHATRLEEDEMVKAEEAELTDQTDTDEDSDEESDLDMEERAVLESQRQVCVLGFKQTN